MARKSKTQDTAAKPKTRSKSAKVVNLLDYDIDVFFPRLSIKYRQKELDLATKVSDRLLADMTAFADKNGGVIENVSEGGRIYTCAIFDLEDCKLVVRGCAASTSEITSSNVILAISISYQAHYTTETPFNIYGIPSASITEAIESLCEIRGSAQPGATSVVA